MRPKSSQANSKYTYSEMQAPLSVLDHAPSHRCFTLHLPRTLPLLLQGAFLDTTVQPGGRHGFMCYMSTRALLYVPVHLALPLGSSSMKAAPLSYLGVP